MCCRLLWNIFGGSSARFYWKFIYISSEAELSFVDILPLSDEMGNIFSDPIEMSVLFCLCIVVSFTRMGWHRQYQYCASPGQDKNTDIWQDKMFIIFPELVKWQKFHYSRPQKMCALWSKTNYCFYLLTSNHYLFRASEGKWEIGFVGICSSCSN